MARRNLDKPLTQRHIDATRPPATGRLEMRDSATPGLVLRVFSSNARSWCFEYRSPIGERKNQRLTLPAYVSLAEARTTAAGYRAQVLAGADPVKDLKDTRAARQAQYANVVTVAAALDKYEPQFIAAGGVKAKSRQERMKALRRAVAPFHEADLVVLTKVTLINRLNEIEATKGPAARNGAQREIGAWLRWMYEADIVSGVALAGVKMRGVEKERTRVLTDAELAAIMAATADGSAFSDFVRVLLHTGMRRNEASSLQKRDLDFEARTMKVREAVDKTGTERTIPMPDALAPMLAARAGGLEQAHYVFGDGSGFKSKLSGWGKPTARLRAAMPPCDDDNGWTLHDIRRTVVTRLTEADVSPLIIEDLVGHKTGERGGMKRIYNQAVTLRKQAAAVNDWAAKLAALTNVVAFKRVA